MGKKRTSAISNQMEKVLSMMVSEKPLERILSLENRITDIHTHIRQMKEQIWDIKEVLTTAEASAYLGLSESYIYKLTSHENRYPHYKPNGKLVYFNRKELCEWAMRNQIETTGTNDPIDSETL